MTPQQQTRRDVANFTRWAVQFLGYLGILFLGWFALVAS